MSSASSGADDDDEGLSFQLDSESEEDISAGRCVRPRSLRHRLLCLLTTGPARSTHTRTSKRSGASGTTTLVGQLGLTPTRLPPLLLLLPAISPGRYRPTCAHDDASGGLWASDDESDAASRADTYDSTRDGQYRRLGGAVDRVLDGMMNQHRAVDAATHAIGALRPAAALPPSAAARRRHYAPGRSCWFFWQ